MYLRHISHNKLNMELNNTQHKSFLWYLDFEPFTWHIFYGEQCLPFVTEENKDAWQRYLKKVIKKHLKEEVMNTPEFREMSRYGTTRRNAKRYAAISKSLQDNTPIIVA